MGKVNEHDPLYKTQLCPLFMKNQCYNAAKECFYAHAQDDLRPLTQEAHQAMMRMHMMGTWHPGGMHMMPGMMGAAMPPGMMGAGMPPPGMMPPGMSTQGHKLVTNQTTKRRTRRGTTRRRMIRKRRA